MVMAQAKARFNYQTTLLSKKKLSNHPIIMLYVFIGRLWW
jgi:hypothetical protein